MGSGLQKDVINQARLSHESSHRDQRFPVDRSHWYQLIRVNDFKIIELHRGLPYERLFRLSADLRRIALAGIKNLLRTLHRRVQDQRHLSLVGTEIRIARTESESVALPHDRAGLDLHWKIQIANHAL